MHKIHHLLLERYYMADGERDVWTVHVAKVRPRFPGAHRHARRRRVLHRHLHSTDRLDIRRDYHVHRLRSGSHGAHRRPLLLRRPANALVRARPRGRHGSPRLLHLRQQNPAASKAIPDHAHQ